jgi:cytochrome c6
LRRVRAQTGGSVPRVPLALNGYESLLLGVALVFIAFALTVALVIPRWKPAFPGKYLGWFIGGALLLFACQLTAVLLLANLGEENKAEAAPPTQTESTSTETTPSPPPPSSSTTTTSGPTETAPPPSQGDPAAGKAIFTGSAGCNGCHTLADAGATGTVGPNLDQLKPPYDAVVTQVTNGGAVMPAFKDTLTPQQIQDVAAYVSSVSGKSG